MTGKNRYAPNSILRRLREERGWSLQRVADELRQLAEAEDENRLPGVNANMVGGWERGWKRPGPFYQALFCQLYSRPASQLGFVRDESTAIATSMPTVKPRIQPVPAQPFPLIPQLAFTHEQTRTIDLLCSQQETTAEQQAGAWLTLGASGLSQLFNEGWTLTDILTSLQLVLQSMQSLPPMSRRRLLQLGGAAMISSIPIPTGERISEEERMQLTGAMGESIGAAWKLFHTAGNAQVLAVGQALLCLLKQCHSALLPAIQPLLYSVVYRLIGAAMHYQDRFNAALNAHNQSYLTALEGGDAWNMAQSRIWQAYGMEAQGQYEEALQVLETALRLISTQHDTESIRTTAHIIASSAQITALMNNVEETQAKLSASEALLEYLPGPHAEFDRATWLEVAGVCALHLKQFDIAVERLNLALEAQLPESLFRHAAILMPLVMTYAYLGELNTSLELAQNAIPLFNSIHAPGMSRQFVEYTTCALSEAFPDDSKAQTFIANLQQQLLP